MFTYHGNGRGFGPVFRVSTTSPSPHLLQSQVTSKTLIMITHSINCIRDGCLYESMMQSDGCNWFGELRSEGWGSEASTECAGKVICPHYSVPLARSLSQYYTRSTRERRGFSRSYVNKLLPAYGVRHVSFRVLQKLLSVVEEYWICILDLPYLAR
ncbi:hypothetical protein BDR07DRAFT_1417714 [Suillus spraguei]|nr:hypothetical protein BDR07DRAFT_1417714 [Suillus spraguei]